MSHDTQKGSLAYFFPKFSFHRISKEQFILNNLWKYGGPTTIINISRALQ